MMEKALPANTLARRLHTYNWGAVVPFFLLHLACFSVFLVPFHWKWAGLAVLSYAVRMFGVTAGYHRYFSHRTYKLNRVNQFLMAFLAQTSSQKGVLWWAAHHRDHHMNSDRENDIHSPVQRGFWWSHVGWVIANDFDSYDSSRIQDFGKFPELRWLDKHHWVPTTLLGSAFLALGGPGAFVWGYIVATVVLFHGTFSINSLAHIWGSRRFDIPDDSRNNFVLAILTMGEGWHNNHHRFKYSCRQGLRWWEVDFTFYILTMLSWVGVTRELRRPQLGADPGKEAAA